MFKEFLSMFKGTRIDYDAWLWDRRKTINDKLRLNGLKVNKRPIFHRDGVLAGHMWSMVSNEVEEDYEYINEYHYTIWANNIAKSYVSASDLYHAIQEYIETEDATSLYAPFKIQHEKVLGIMNDHISRKEGKLPLR